MYAEVNRWGEVVKMRAAMKNLGVEKKCPGSSWIEMERKIHQLAAFDKSHPASNEIYQIDTHTKYLSNCVILLNIYIYF